MKLSTLALVSMTLVGTAAAAPDPAAKAPAPAAMPAMPKPPKEIADWAKQMSGATTCTGTSMGMDGKSIPMTGKMSGALDSGGWWYHSTFTAKMAKVDFHMDNFSTYDANAKKYRIVMVMSDGGYGVGTSDGPKDGKLEWSVDTQEPMMGASMFKDSVDFSDPKAGVKATGSMSMDKGKTWTQVYTMVCKK